MYVIVTNNEKVLKVAKATGSQIVKTTLNSFDEANTPAEVNELLISLGIRHGLSGFKYIKFILEHNIDCSRGLTSHVYPFLAKCFDTTYSCTERCIRHAIDVGFANELYRKRYEELFGILKKTPTNQTFLEGCRHFLNANKNHSIETDTCSSDAIKNEKSNKVTKMLFSLGIRHNVLGFKYLTFIFENDFAYNATKEYAYKVASHFGTTSTAVERAIYHAIQTGFESNLHKKFYQEVFGILQKKPTTLKFIEGFRKYLNSQLSI